MVTIKYCVTVTADGGFGLVIGFINNLQVINTINYYTVAALHNVHSLHTNLQCIYTSLHRFMTQKL
jgi:hypothetical protein